MIEGEEIFESASETGYRLCSSGQTGGTVEREDDNKIFSASWDKNNRKRLFICSQNGLLKVYNLENNNTAKYEIFFRRYTTFENSIAEPEKRINQHWDKMVTIADRPNEIIFLLGISKVLMYTCLPGSDSTNINVPYPNGSAAIATMTRSDFPGYIYGTPVMEIATHVARVTSMAVSPSGHVLASGDEHGNVRLLLLQLLDSISNFKKEEQKKKKHTKARMFNDFKASYNITNKAHEGSLFSMEWLPVTSTKDDVRYYGLVTGSVDRAVRIWTVSCCSRNGLKMIPCQLLDTLSTHILSLCTYELTDKVQEMAIARTISARRLMNNDNDRHEDLMTAYSAKDIPNYSMTEQEEMNTCKSIYIAAGTNVGTIYVWKLSLVNMIDSLMSADASTNTTNVSASKSSITRKPNEFSIDDGTALLSLLQPSDKPIVHVSVSSNGHQTITTADLLSGNDLLVDTSKLNCADNVIMAAADIGGVVHLQCVDRNVDLEHLGELAEELLNAKMFDSPQKTASVKSDNTMMTTSMRIDRIQQENLRSHLVTVQRMKDSLRGNARLAMLENTKSSLSGGQSVMTTNKPLVSVGSQVYDSPVVACAFQAVYVPPVVTEENKETVVVDHVAPPGLLVCTASGLIKYYSSDSLPSVVDPNALAKSSHNTPMLRSPASTKSSSSSNSTPAKDTPESKSSLNKELFAMKGVQDGLDDISEGSDLSDEPGVTKSSGKDASFRKLEGRRLQSVESMGKMSMLTLDSAPVERSSAAASKVVPPQPTAGSNDRTSTTIPFASPNKKTSGDSSVPVSKTGGSAPAAPKAAPKLEQTVSESESESGPAPRKTPPPAPSPVKSSTAAAVSAAIGGPMLAKSSAAGFTKLANNVDKPTAKASSSSAGAPPASSVSAVKVKTSSGAREVHQEEDDSISFRQTPHFAKSTDSSTLAKHARLKPHSGEEVEPHLNAPVPQPYPMLPSSLLHQRQTPVIEPSERIPTKFENNFANPAVNHSKV